MEVLSVVEGDAAVNASAYIASPDAAQAPDSATDIAASITAGGADSYDTSSIHAVHVDALVALKIARHARESFPSAIAGVLLGIDIDGVLHVTNSFRQLPVSLAAAAAAAAAAQSASAMLTPGSEEAAASIECEDYQLAMMDCMRAVNADCNSVGWYQSAAAAVNIFNMSMLLHQSDYQRTIAQSIVLDYDFTESMTGVLALRAYRLTDVFFSILRGTHPQSVSIDQITTSGMLKHGMLEELPVSMRCSSLMAAFVHTHGLAREVGTPMVPHSASVERRLAGVITSLDEFAGDHTRAANWPRTATASNSGNANSRVRAMPRARRLGSASATCDYADTHDDETIALRNAAFPFARRRIAPSKIDTLLISHQISHHCKSVTGALLPSVLGMELSRAANAADPSNNYTIPAIAEDEDNNNDVNAYYEEDAQEAD